MSPPIRVRRAAAADRTQLLPLARELAASSDVEDVAFNTTFDALLADPRHLVLVAEHRVHLLGYALAGLRPTFHANGPVVWVEEVMVDHGHRRTGIGRALMNQILEWAETHDAAHVALATRRAAHFYEALGYEPSATYFKRILSPRPPASGDRLPAGAHP